MQPPNRKRRVIQVLIAVALVASVIFVLAWIGRRVIIAEQSRRFSSVIGLAHALQQNGLGCAKPVIDNFAPSGEQRASCISEPGSAQDPIGIFVFPQGVLDPKKMPPMAAVVGSNWIVSVPIRGVSSTQRAGFARAVMDAFGGHYINLQEACRRAKVTPCPG
jgi:hypothetical protein